MRRADKSTLIFLIATLFGISGLLVALDDVASIGLILCNVLSYLGAFCYVPMHGRAPHVDLCSCVHIINKFDHLNSRAVSLE